jgi:hypothetical protein
LSVLDAGSQADTELRFGGDSTAAKQEERR